LNLGHWYVFEDPCYSYGLSNLAYSSSVFKGVCIYKSHTSTIKKRRDERSLVEGSCLAYHVRTIGREYLGSRWPNHRAPSSRLWKTKSNIHRLVFRMSLMIGETIRGAAFWRPLLEDAFRSTKWRWQSWLGGTQMRDFDEVARFASRRVWVFDQAIWAILVNNLPNFNVGQIASQCSKLPSQENHLNDMALLELHWAVKWELRYDWLKR